MFERFTFYVEQSRKEKRMMDVFKPMTNALCVFSGPIVGGRRRRTYRRRANKRRTTRRR